MKIIIAKSLSAVGLVAASGAAFAANTGILSAMPDSNQSLADAIGQTADANDPNQSAEQAIPVEVTESAGSSNPFQAFIEVFTGDNDDDSKAGKDVDWNSVSPTRPATTPTTNEPSNSATPETKEEPSDEPTYSNGGGNGGTASRPDRETPSFTESGGSETSSGSSSNNSDTSSGGSASGDDDDDDDHDDDDHDDDDDDDDDDEEDDD